LAANRTVALEDELQEGGESGPAAYPEAAIDRQTLEANLLQMADRAALRAPMEALLEVIFLCDVEEMKYRDIAIALEIPIGTVMSRIARARLALRTALGAQHTMSRESRA
jgi:RNA polymerase sigma-70 factor (ECF subfamily)